MNDFEEQIEKKKDDIKKAQETINEYNGKKLTAIFEMRKILEDEKNHEDNKIYKRLKKEKEKEYMDKLREYKENYEEWEKTIKRRKKEIDDAINNIIDITEKMKLVKTKESQKEQEFQQKRKEIFEIVSGYIRDKEINQEMIAKVEKIVNGK